MQRSARCRASAAQCISHSEFEKLARCMAAPSHLSNCRDQVEITSLRATSCLQVVFTFLTKSYAPGAATAIVQWNTLPVAFGCLAFCFAGHGVFPAIRASMQEPKKFPKVKHRPHTACSVAAWAYSVWATSLCSKSVFFHPHCNAAV